MSLYNIFEVLMITNVLKEQFDMVIYDQVCMNID